MRLGVWTCAGHRSFEVADSASHEECDIAARAEMERARVETQEAGEAWERTATPEMLATRERNRERLREYEAQLLAYHAKPVWHPLDDPNMPRPPALEPMPS